MSRPDPERPAGPDRVPPPAPRWVRVLAVVAALVLVVVVVLLAAGGGHGPGRHLSADLAGVPPAGPVR